MKPSEAEVRLILAIAVSVTTMLAAGAEEQPSLPRAPALGDLMGGTQLRHFKLAFAGKLQNWDLAKYEVARMRSSFDAAAKLYPVLGNVPLAKLTDEVSVPALVEVDKSIDAKDASAFLRAFERLTEACNSCHRTAGFGFIAIRVPTSSPFSNQSFTPSAK
jgi:hypothetical protein